MKVIISRIIIMTSIMLAMGLFSESNNNNNYNICIFSRRRFFSIYSLGAADPNNDLSFDPPQINVPTGSIVSWTNADSIQHTVTSDEQGLFDAGPIFPGDTFENVFDSAGEFGYHGSIHPFMTGVITVG
jgi:plastocyanin